MKIPAGVRTEQDDLVKPGTKMGLEESSQFGKRSLSRCHVKFE